MRERGDSDWQEASTGLRMVASAMILQLVLVAFTLLGILFAVTTDKPDGLRVLAMLFAAVGLLAQIMLVTGEFRFSNQPPPRPGASLARAACAFGVVGIALTFYVLFALLQVSSVGPDSDYDKIRSAREVAKALPKIEVLAAVAGFLGMTLLLAAAASVARHFQQRDLERKARTAIAMVLLASGTYAFVKLGVTPREASSLIAALMMVTIVQVAAFVNILGTVRGLSEAVLAPSPPELPRARSL